MVNTRKNAVEKVLQLKEATKVASTENYADLMTKGLSADVIRYLMHGMGHRFMGVESQ